MQLSRSYFDHLLRDADPVEAIAALSQFWSTRADSMRPCFGLSRPEYNVQLCLIYFGEVGNGGLTQYFMNRGCRLVADTCDAFDEIGFSELAEPLQSAAAAWQDAGDDGTLPVGLDQAAGLVADIDCKLLDYIRRNADDILVSERKSQPYEQPNA